MNVERRAEVAGGCWLDRASFSLRPTDVWSALAALDGVSDHFLKTGDARAAFPDIYSVITRRVAERTEWGPKRFFREPAWISRLAGRFCERYLETLRWSLAGEEQDCSAWAAAYALSRRPTAPPIQHAFLGLAAHINYDLALGISRTLADHGCASDPAKLARCKHDHDVVNELLRESYAVALHRLVERHGCGPSVRLLEGARHPSEWVTMQLLGSWREHVWGDSTALLHAKTKSENQAILARMERRSRRITNGLAALQVPRRWLS